VWWLFELTILAFAIGWIVPSGFVAGIPAAAWFLHRRGIPFKRALASFGIGRFFEITAYVLILPMVLLSELGAKPVIRAVSGMLLGGIALVYLDVWFRWRLARRTLAVVRSATPRFAHRSLEHAADVCATVGEFFTGPPRHIALAVVYSFLAIGVAYVRAWLTSEFLGLGLTPTQLAVMLAITIFLMAIPFLPGALGAFEGGMAGAFELLGRDKADGVAYAMTVHATELVVVVAGVLVLVHLGIRPRQLVRPESEAAPASGRPLRRRPATIRSGSG
jgi:uncharacterized protein (TIRG00374 family)